MEQKNLEIAELQRKLETVQTKVRAVESELQEKSAKLGVYEQLDY